jgi:cap1 methyltransferase
LKGLDGTGNIYNLDNHIFMENRIVNKKAEIVTADGGFDFSVNYNQQEFLAQKLIFSQVVLGVSIQENGGSFIIKFFDTYSYISNQILFLLMTLYKSVYIFKPYTSRPANSERYIVCKGFYGISASRVGMLRETLHIWNTLPKHINMKSLFSGLPDKFLKDMKDLNNYIQKEQIQYIEATIYLMENNNNIGNNNIGNNKYKSYNEDQQIELAKLWCKKYGVPSI